MTTAKQYLTKGNFSEMVRDYTVRVRGEKLFREVPTVYDALGRLREIMGILEQAAAPADGLFFEGRDEMAKMVFVNPLLALAAMCQHVAEQLEISPLAEGIVGPDAETIRRIGEDD